MRDTILAGDLDGYRVVAETLADEFDPMDVAAAAVKLAHEATAGGRDDEEPEIPAAASAPEPGPAKGRRRRREASPRRGPSRGRPRQCRPRRGRDAAGLHRSGTQGGDPPGRPGRRDRQRGGGLVRDIGAIEIADKFSLVELSEGVVERVASALRATTIKRKRVIVRIERPGPTSG